MTVSADGPAVPMMPSPPVSAGAAVSDDLGPVRTISRLGPACHGSPSQQDPPGHYPGPDGGRPVGPGRQHESEGERHRRGRSQRSASGVELIRVAQLVLDHGGHTVDVLDDQGLVDHAARELPALGELQRGAEIGEAVNGEGRVDLDAE